MRTRNTTHFISTFLILFLAGAGFGLTGNAAPVLNDEPKVFSTLPFEAALQKAGREKKLVFIDFFATWCGPCKMLDKTTWRDPKVTKWLEANTVPLKIDAEKEVELAKRYGVGAYPTMVFIRADGTVLDRIIGYHPPEQFLRKAVAYLSGKDSAALAREELKGHENDPQRRMAYARALAEKGDDAKALEEYLWCYDNGVAKDPAFIGVRGSFLVSYILQLAKRYPPARDAMVKRRDEAGNKILSGTAEQPALNDFIALNRAFKEREANLKLYDSLKTGDARARKSREQLSVEVLDLLVTAKRYADALEFIPDPMERITAGISTYERAKAILEKKLQDENKQKTFQIIRKNMVSEWSGIYESLVGTGRTEEAGKLAAQIIEFENTGETHALFIEKAVRAGDRKSALSIAARGRELRLPEQRAIVEAAAAKIPVE
jgi:thioredoxin 1